MARDEDEPQPVEPESEALHALIAAWRARDWLEQHAGELDSDAPCRQCLGVVRAVFRGKQGAFVDLCCADARQARRQITEAQRAVKQATGEAIFG